MTVTRRAMLLRSDIGDEMRQTSLQAYNTIKENGLLSQRRLQVYEFLYEHGPLTIADLCARFQRHHYNGSFAGRISELSRMGVIKEVGIKTNEYSGHDAILWDVTSELPQKVDKKENRKTIWIFCPKDFDEPWTYYSTREKAEAMRLQMSGTIYMAVKK